MFSNNWNKLRSKKYREAFVLQAFKRIVPFQIYAMRKKRGWSQEKLAEQAKVTQGVVSRAEDPDYGNLTINTICRIAAGFDVAFIGKFVPFSELDRWFNNLSEASGIVPSFDEDGVIPFVSLPEIGQNQGTSLEEDEKNLFGDALPGPTKAQTGREMTGQRAAAWR
jgi:transcriptional regulator with XRE-family HTH domain